MAQTLKESISVLRSASTPLRPEPKSESDEKKILGVIQRRKMSKRTLANFIDKAAPKINLANLVALGTTRGMIQKFFDIATPNEIKRLTDLLTNGDSPDAYLKGIVRRE